MRSTRQDWPEIPWGLCALIAEDEAEKAGGHMVGGVVVVAAGEIAHWWAEADGRVIDPMVDALGVDVIDRRPAAHADPDGALFMAWWNASVRDEDPDEWDAGCDEITDAIRAGTIPEGLAPR